jgi:hypothetical protein
MRLRISVDHHYLSMASILHHGKNKRAWKADPLPLRAKRGIQGATDEIWRKRSFCAELGGDARCARLE